MTCYEGFLQQRRLHRLLFAKLVIYGFYVTSCTSASGAGKEKKLLPCARVSSQDLEGIALNTTPEPDSHIENGVRSIKCTHMSPPRLLSTAKEHSENLPHQKRKGHCAFEATPGDRPARLKDDLGCQEKQRRALPPSGTEKISVSAANVKNQTGSPPADALSGGNRPLPRAVREQNLENPDAPAPDRRRQDHQTELQKLSARVKRFEFGRNSSGLRRLVAGWAGYPAYLSWYRARYLPWYYRMYGAAATPPLPASPVVTALYQGNLVAPQAAFVNVPITAASLNTAPLTMAPMVSAPVAATAQSMLPAASVGIVPAASAAPTEALLSLQEPSTRATLAAVPLVDSASAALTAASGAYGLAPSGTVVAPTITPVGISPAVVSTTAAAAPAVLANAPFTMAAPTAVAVPAPTSSPTAVAAPAAIAVPSTSLTTPTLLGTPASVATFPASTAVPAILSAPAAASELPVASNALKLSRRSSGGVAGLGLANFAAFLARPDGTLAAVGGTGE